MGKGELKIYFAASVRAGRGDADVYYHLVRYLGKYGRVLTEHLGQQLNTHKPAALPEK